MQNQPPFRFIRQLLLPYCWEKPLSSKQGLRMIITWALFFGLIMSLCSMPVALAFMSTISLQRTMLFFLLAFLSGVVAFGSLAWVVVIMTNRTAQIMQRRKADQ